MAGCCYNGNELLGFIKLLDYQKDYLLLKDNSSMEFFSGFVRICFEANKISYSRSASRLDL